MAFYLTQSLHRVLQLRSKHPATVFGERRQTWAEVGDRVARLAGALQGLGLRAGERVGMMALNSDRYLEYYFGTWWAGCVVNPVNVRWSPAEVAYSLDDCDTTVLIVDDHFAPMVAELRTRSRSLRTVIHVGVGAPPEGMLSWERLVAQASPAQDAMRAGDDLAGVFYTGGTTGFPKGVMLSHTNLASNALTDVADGLVAPDGTALMVAPMFHLAATALLLSNMIVGSRLVFLPSFTPQGVLGAIQAEQVTSALLVPTMIQMVIDHPSLKDHDTRSLRDVAYGASPISEGVMNRALAALPGARFTQAYGMTELSPCATFLPPWYHTAEGRGAGKIRSAGRAASACEVRITDPDDREVPRGTVGEVCVRGPGVMQGYWNQPELTAQALRGGWMHTGDAAYMDEDGFVFIVDRVKDMIVTGGENVYSVEVESALSQHPAVAAASVIGIPDDKWGEAVHAVVVFKPGQSASAEALVAHARGLIAGYKCPRSIEVREALPLTAAGKVQKTELRKPFWEGQSRNVA